MKIAIVGKMRSGKDTVASYFKENHGAVQLAFGDGIKQVSNVFFPQIVAKGKPRFLYQTIGQQFRQIDSDVWVNYLERTYDQLLDEGVENFVISDVRQRNEYEYMKNNGFTIIKVEAANEIRKERIERSGDFFNEEDFFHETETEVDTIPFDYLLTNNTSLEDFMTQLEYVAKEIIGEEKK